MQLGALAPLDTVDRPRPTELPEGVVIGRMPVSCGDHELRLASETVDGLHHGTAICSGERAAFTEVVLDIYGDECIH